MMYVLLHDGHVVEVPTAERARVVGMQLILHDSNDTLVQVFSTQDISAYGKHEAMGQFARFER